MELTPAMKQYMDIKREYKDAILFFRMGDFYEMFFEDAIYAARVLDIALTSRDRDSGIPMCGIPYHAKDSYLGKILKDGRNVAVCEQIGQQGKGGIFSREVVEVLTPGLIPREDLLEPERGNFLVSINLSETFSLSGADISTGELYHEEVDRADEILDYLKKIDVGEIIFDEDTAGKIKYSGFENKLPPTVPRRIVAVHNRENTSEVISECFGGAGMKDTGFILLVDYILRNQPGAVKSLPEPHSFRAFGGLYLDEAALNSLEILTSMKGGKKGSLLGILDQTATPMGKRMMKRWLAYPLSDLENILLRLEAVEELVLDPGLMNDLLGSLGSMCDLERAGVKLSSRRVHPRDLSSIMLGMAQAIGAKEKLEPAVSPGLSSRGKRIDPLYPLIEEIEQAVIQNPPASIREGGVIKPGFDERIDRLREIRDGGVRFLGEMEVREREKCQIPNLKVKYNRVFGYFIEVSKSYLDRVPPEYVRKQTLVNSERFITPELKEFESRQLSASDELARLEEQVFGELLNRIWEYGEFVVENARIIAEVDVLCSFAGIARRHGYTRPTVHEGVELEIVQGRHPVVENSVGRKSFVANDTFLNPRDEQIMVITGPNMAGKSTYIRQVALMVVMAHAGSFVPADEAKIPLIYSIFTRIGGADNIHLGESTFMVEMKEVSKILSEVTDRSLVVLDEIGRGTSTYDGLSIAWAVIEHIHSLKGKNPLTLFATHYHEICELEKHLERVKNYNVMVREWNDQILFIRKIRRGPSSKSYGIYVGEIAGLPREVTSRAKEILKSLEDNEYNGSKIQALSDSEGDNRQLTLFRKEKKFEEIKMLVENVELDKMTPLEALNVLAEIKEAWKELKEKE